MAVENHFPPNSERDFILRVDRAEVKGFISKQNVANFLGVPFAQFPARFRTATKIDLSDLEGIVDATQYGPRCPQKVDTIHPVMGHVFEQLSTTQRCDENSCLHLNIYGPAEAINAPDDKKIPVYAWIHGGGFNNGDNTIEFDGNHLVQRSVELGKPIVIVTINYRLNLFGFSASRELTEEARSLGETPVMNQGLNDQRLALQWIQTSIQYFGGDASKVTISGESAGALSVFYHIHGGQRLFHQALIQSTPAPHIRTLEHGQRSFDQLVQSTGIPADTSSSGKLTALRALPTDEILELFDGAIPTPIEDPDWFAPYVSSESAAFWGQMPEWCSKVILGHTKDEAALFFMPLVNGTESELINFVRTNAPGISVEAIFPDGKASLQTLITRVTEDTFIHPTLELASAASEHTGKVYLYAINLVDPFPGPLHGYAWHSWGVPLTFYQPPGRVWPQIRITQEKMSTAYLKFIYGLEPWEAFNVARRQMSWDGEQSGLTTINLSEQRVVNQKSSMNDHTNPGSLSQTLVSRALTLQTSSRSFRL